MSDELTEARLRECYVEEDLTVRETAAALGRDQTEVLDALQATDWYDPELATVLRQRERERDPKIVTDGGRPLDGDHTASGDGTGDQPTGTEPIYLHHARDGKHHVSTPLSYPELNGLVAPDAWADDPRDNTERIEHEVFTAAPDDVLDAIPQEDVRTWVEDGPLRVGELQVADGVIVDVTIYDVEEWAVDAADGEEEIVTDGGTVEVCPECDSAPIESLVGPNARDAQNAADNQFWCETCGARFDDPVDRPARGDTAPKSGLAATLDEMDPADLVTDGGQQSIVVEGPIPDECTTKLCDSDPIWAVGFENDVSRVTERDHDEGPPDGAVCPYVCETCRQERYQHIDEDRWTRVAVVATDGGTVSVCPECGGQPRNVVGAGKFGPELDHEVGCSDCPWTGDVDDLAERAPAHSGGGLNRGLAARLDDLDPDAVCGDEDLRADGGEALTDEQVHRALRANERQADALESLVAELEHQNAVLTELARATHEVAVAASDRPIDHEPRVPTHRSMHGCIEDAQHTREQQEGDGL